MHNRTIVASRRLGGVATQPGDHGGTFRRRRPTPSVIATEGVRWVCARVRSGREFAVADDLAAMGFKVFAPHGVKVYMRARVRGSEARARAERDYPVFGSYVFIGEPDGAHIRRDHHPHIFDILQNAGGSRSIPSAFIERAAKAWADGKWDNRISAADRLVGKAVKITSGAMEGWTAIVDSLPSELKAVVSVVMFGSERRVKVDTTMLEVV